MSMVTDELGFIAWAVPQTPCGLEGESPRGHIPLPPKKGGRSDYTGNEIPKRRFWTLAKISLGCSPPTIVNQWLSGILRFAQMFKTLHYSVKPRSFLKWTKNELGVLVTSVEESNGLNKILRSTLVIFIMGLKDTHPNSPTGLTDCPLRSSQYVLMEPMSQTHGGTEYNQPRCVAGTYDSWAQLSHSCHLPKARCWHHRA